MVNKRVWAICIVVLMLALAGCDDGGSGLGDASVGDEVDSADFAVLGAEDAFANVEDATLAAAMEMNDPVASGGFARHPRHPGHPGSHLRRILRRLDISLDQLRDIRDLVRAHREAVRPAFQGLREANADLLEQARVDRRAILDELDAGNITEDEAKEQLKALSEATREAIRDNPDNQPFFDEICAARVDLFASISLVLDDDQRALFDEWVSSLDGYCFS